MQHLSQFIIHHWPLWVALVILLMLVLINEWFTQKNRPKQLSTSAAVDMINHHDAVVVDLRGSELYRAGHIIDSIQATEEDFNKQKMDKYKEKPIILVCARGQQSSTLAQKLQNGNFTQPMVLAGGFSAWQAAGLPIVKGK